MEFFKQFLREAGIQVAFVVVGALLLISFWLTGNVQQSVFEEYRNDKISIVFSGEPSEAFKTLMQQDSDVIRYEIIDSDENKNRLSTNFPELAGVLESLDKEYFPHSALVTVKDAKRFLPKLDELVSQFESRMLHEKPTVLLTVFRVALGLFLFLWFLLLILLVYFQIEKLSVREASRWSLMKMLGAKPSQVFLPHCWTQLFRVAVTSFFALLIATYAVNSLRELFNWSWPGMAWGMQAAFLAAAVVSWLLLFSGLFTLRYSRTALG